MTGLIALGLLLAFGVVAIAAVGFVFIAMITLVGQLAVRSAPFFGRMAKGIAVGCAALVLTLTSVNIVTVQANQPNAEQGAFAFIRPVKVFQVEADSKPQPDDEEEIAASEKAADDQISISSAAIAEKNPDPNLPSWATETKPNNGETTYHVLQSPLMVTREEALSQIHEQAAKLIRDDFAKRNTAKVDWELPTQVVEDSIRRTYFTTESKMDLLENSTLIPDMHRAYAQITLSPSMRDAIYPGWRKLVASQRLVKIGQGFGIVTMVIMALAMYLRYDKQTLGRKKGRLGMLSIAILASGSMAVAALGDSLKSKLASAGIVEAEYVRGRVSDLEKTVIIDNGPVIEIDNDASKVAILIENVGQIERLDVICKQVTDCIDSLSKNTSIDVHAISSTSSRTLTFNGGEGSVSAIEQLITRYSGHGSDITRSLEQVLASRPESVIVLTEGLGELSDSDRSGVTSIASKIPISFVKLIDEKPIRFDETLREFATSTGGSLRLLDTGE